MTESAETAVITGTSGTRRLSATNMPARTADNAVAIAPAATHSALRRSTFTSIRHITSDRLAVMCHLYANIRLHNPLSPAAGAPKLAKMSISTSVKKNAVVCHIGRFPSGGTMFICSSRFAFSSPRKINDMTSPMLTENATDPAMRAMPSSMPRMRVVSITDRMLTDGPE